VSVVPSLAVACVLGLAQGTAPSPAGHWNAWLASPGGEIHFGLGIRCLATGCTASIENGGESVEVPLVTFDENTRALTLQFPQTKSSIRARLVSDPSKSELVGVWSRSQFGATNRMVFRAKPTEIGGCSLSDAASSAPEVSLVGRWRASFSSGPDISVATLGWSAEHGLTATFSTRTLRSDLRGCIDAYERSVTFSRFDGTNAYLLNARLQGDASMAGDFWSADTWHEKWTAIHDIRSVSAERSEPTRASELRAPAAPAPTDWSELPAGSWNAWLDSPGGRLDCPMTLRRDRGETIVEFSNAYESVSATTVAWNRGRLALELEFSDYDARIVSVASSAGLHLDGEWSVRASADRWTKLAFHADFVAVINGGCTMPGTGGLERSPFDGRWSLRLGPNSELGVAILDAQSVSTSVVARILTTRGDLGLFRGRCSKEQRTVELARFDGASALLFKGRLEADGSIAGELWSDDSSREAWTATLDASAALPDPFEQTRAVDGAQIAMLEFADLARKTRSLAEWPGQPRLIALLGSWSRNSQDDADYLRELDLRFAKRGLQVIGVAFERTGDFARDADRVKLFAQRHRLRFPMLLGGASDPELASARVPVIDRVRSFPTTLFVRADGSIRAVYQGFIGPTSRDEHARQREDFERILEELVEQNAARR
jgi:hypothetical protein